MALLASFSTNTGIFGLFSVITADIRNINRSAGYNTQYTEY